MENTIENQVNTKSMYRTILCELSNNIDDNISYMEEISKSIKDKGTADMLDIFAHYTGEHIDTVAPKAFLLLSKMLNECCKQLENTSSTIKAILRMVLIETIDDPL